MCPQRLQAAPSNSRHPFNHNTIPRRYPRVPRPPPPLQQTLWNFIRPHLPTPFQPEIPTNPEIEHPVDPTPQTQPQTEPTQYDNSPNSNLLPPQSQQPLLRETDNLGWGDHVQANHPQGSF